MLAVLFAGTITLRITRPVLRMAGLLDRLAWEDPVERIPTVAGARDEINAMAESLNEMADHKAKMLAWWKRSVEAMEKEQTA